MPTAQSTFVTPKASRYLQQLCKHFAHKVTVTYDDQKGQVDFPLGQAELTASLDRLEFFVQADTDEGLAKCQYILEDHITRFAFREGLQRLDWSA